MRDLTVVSNDLALCADFCDHPSVDLICVGGRVETGEPVDRRAGSPRWRWRELSLDIAFLSSSSWDVRHGVTTPVEAKVEVKRAAMASATTSVLVAGSAKFGRFARYRVLRLDEIDTVICDPALDESDAARIEGLGVDVVRAPLG